MIAPRPPRTLSMRKISRLASLALTQGGNWPVKLTLNMRGMLIKYAPPAMATATSMPPAPMASMPSAPPVGVWLSEPISVLPGFPKRSRCT